MQEKTVNNPSNKAVSLLQNFFVILYTGIRVNNERKNPI